jgi:sugar phosphate isomerase/epimerase
MASTTRLRTLGFTFQLALLSWVPVTAEPADQDGFPHAFFAFDNGTGRDEVAPEDQARMLKDLGYDGIGYTGAKGIPEMLAALDTHGLKLFSIYVSAFIGDDGPSFDPNLPAAIEQLKGRETVIWLTVYGAAENGDEQAVKIVREIGDLARKANLRVALYPHVGFHVARVEDALRIVKQVDLPNVGASFNLCHWLSAGDAANMKLRLEQSLPHLFLVSINGADHEGGWDRLIQTLDRGEFDVYGFVRMLDEQGYAGPIGLQCYNVPGDRRENLSRSMAAWRVFSERRAQEFGR